MEYSLIILKVLSAELAYLGRGNSVQKALSDEIKSHIINISDSHSLMKTWLITNYGGPSRIVGDIVNNLARKPSQQLVIERRNLPFSYH